MTNRNAIELLIAQDVIYDNDPKGDPPITVHRYRAAIQAVLALTSADPGPNATTWSNRERDAFLAGSRASLRDAVDALAHALRGTSSL